MCGERGIVLMIKKIVKWVMKSLYMQIVFYLAVSIVFGILVMFGAKAIGKNIIVSNGSYNQDAIQEKLDTTFTTLQEEVSLDDGEIYDVLDEWTYKNKYYVLYLISDDGTLYYTNDGLNTVGDSEVSFPTEKLYTMVIDNTNVNVSITYLYAAEMSALIENTSIIVGFIVAIIIFVLLFKKIVDRIKKISYQLEIVSGGDSEVSIIDNSEDEIGILVDNINQMRNSLMTQYSQVEELERKQHQKIAVLSHDIRTPLTVIKGYLEILRNTKEEQDKKLYLDKFEEKLLEIQYLSFELFENLDESSSKNKQNKQIFEISGANFIEEIARFKQNLILSDFTLEVSEVPHFKALSLKELELRQILTSIHSNLIGYALSKYPIILNFEIEENRLKITLLNHIDRMKKPKYSSRKGLELQKNILKDKGGDLIIQSDIEMFKTIILIPLS